MDKQASRETAILRELQQAGSVRGVSDAMIASYDAAGVAIKRA